MLKNLIISIIVFLLFMSGSHAQLTGTERILLFDSEIQIMPSGIIRVKETITVEAANQKINRGIYREIPTDYRDKFQNRVSIILNIESVKKNGNPEPFHTERLSNGIRIYIGDRNRYLSPGIYSYEITYQVTYALGFFEKFDELYWNVTGNGWIFPIEKARANIQLPKGANIVQHAAYTGAQGAAGQDFVAKEQTDRISFESTRILQSFEGLTIAVAWPKGFVNVPTQREKVTRVLDQNLPIYISSVFLFVILGYYCIAWILIGRDPTKGTIIPLYEPPQNLSPAMLHYIYYMGFRSNTAFTAALVNMAVKGYVQLIENSLDYQVERRSDLDEHASAGEKIIYESLFKSKKKIVFSNKNHELIHKAIHGFEKKIKSELAAHYFVTNRTAFLIGLILTLIYVITLAVSIDESSTFIFMTIWLSIWTVAVTVLWAAVYYSWALAKDGHLFKVSGAVLITAFSIPFFIGEIVGIIVLGNAISYTAVGILTLVMFLNFCFYQLLKRRTIYGRKVMDEIEGFKMFLSISEKQDLQGIHPPDITAELFERFLPYAIALGIEHDWCKKFEASTRTLRDEQDYKPNWYTGKAFSTLGVSGLSKAIGIDLDSAISSSSRAPGSSSGSGGGGSSGGGGGGGGGGGW